MKNTRWFIGIAFLSLLLMGGCGLLSSDNKDDTLTGTLVFSAQDEEGKNQIFTMRPDGSGLRQLTVMNGSSVQPSWSPDGQQIVFSSFNQHTSVGPAVWVMNADGSDLRPLHDFEPETERSSALNGNNPRWSPDGTKVAFDLCVNCQVSTNPAIFVFDLVSEELTRLTVEPLGHSSMHPSWSQDGTRIAFTANRDYVDADTLRFRRDLYVMDADGNNQTRITTTGNATRPVWSPDGNKIAYEWGIQGNSVFLYDISSGEITQVDSGLEFSGTPMWNHNGTELLLIGQKTQNSSPEIRLLTINNGEFKMKQSFDLKEGGIDYDWFVPATN